MASRAVLFLHGRYAARDISHYKKLCSDAFLIAVDGGFSFFRKSGLIPDLLIGDFDSIGRKPKGLPEATTVIEAEVRKDQTDGEMALRFCLERGFRKIDIVQPDYGDPDHFLGNVMLLRLAGTVRSKSRQRPAVRLVSRGEEIHYLKDGSVAIIEAAGSPVSLLPLSGTVRYSCSGTDYRVDDVLLRPGETRGLRNRITARRARFSVEGEALLIRRFGKR